MAGADSKYRGQTRPVAWRRNLRTVAGTWWNPPRASPPVYPVILAVSVLAILAFSVQALPPAVNGMAYLVGAERSDTFTAVSHEQTCARCDTKTIGVLRRTGQRVSLPEVIPLGNSIPARDPIWSPSFATGLIENDTGAVNAIAAEAGFWAIAIFFGIPVFRFPWRSARRR